MSRGIYEKYWCELGWRYRSSVGQKLVYADQQFNSSYEDYCPGTAENYLVCHSPRHSMSTLAYHRLSPSSGNGMGLNLFGKEHDATLNENLFDKYHRSFSKDLEIRVSTRT